MLLFCSPHTDLRAEFSLGFNARKAIKPLNFVCFDGTLTCLLGRLITTSELAAVVNVGRLLVSVLS